MLDMDSTIVRGSLERKEYIGIRVDRESYAFFRWYGRGTL